MKVSSHSSFPQASFMRDCVKCCNKCVGLGEKFYCYPELVGGDEIRK